MFVVFIKTVTIKSRLQSLIYALNYHRPTSVQYGTINKVTHLLFSVLSMSLTGKNAFSNIDFVKKIEIINGIIPIIFSNYCLFKTIICNDKDPPWLTDRIKNLIEIKNALCKIILTLPVSIPD